MNAGLFTGAFSLVGVQMEASGIFSGNVRLAAVVLASPVQLFSGACSL